GTDGNIVGGACAEGGDCASDSRCLQEDEFPAGTCTVECETQSDCPGGTRCVAEHGGSCLLTCRNDEDCREDYTCGEAETTPGEEEVRVCLGDR
ncbi:MAG: hypothetical protein ABEN55_15920, partial [Bradymonadaceae bacterium]